MFERGHAIKTCPECKTEYSDDMVFCPQCGKRLVPVVTDRGGIVGGAYRVIESVGSGWAGVVFKAEHIMMGRTTALKVISSTAASEAGFADRFREAAHLLSDLSDPRIATVHDMGIEAPSRVFIAAEFVEGKSLAAVIEETGLVAPQRFLDIIRPVIQGLGSAHALGLIHGSLKPSNIILPDDSSQPKIVDFATRRIVVALGDEKFTTNTPYGPVYGDVAYLAPEQIKGEQADERTDVYCLGLVMYEMLTGARPYGVDLAADVARAHVEASAESMRSFKPHLKIPKFIDKAVMRALEKDPQRRQAGAAELADELHGEIIPEKRLTSARVRQARPAPKAPERKAPAAAGAAKAGAAPTEPAPVTGPRLVLYKGKKVAEVFPLDKPKMLVGRSPECDILIDDQAVSRVHARISKKGDRIIVEDLDSLNGTYINKDAVRRGHIEHKDKVVFGSVVLVFRTD